MRGKLRFDRFGRCGLVGGAARAFAVPVTPCWAASSRTRWNTSRTWASGMAPLNSCTGWPPITAATVGIDCAWNAWESCGFESTSTLARMNAPSYSATSFSSTGVSCLQGSHHSAQRSTMTGTVIDSSRISAKFASVPSSTRLGTGTGPAAAAAAGAPGAGAGGRFTSEDRSTAPRRLTPDGGTWVI